MEPARSTSRKEVPVPLQMIAHRVILFAVFRSLKQWALLNLSCVTALLQAARFVLAVWLKMSGLICLTVAATVVIMPVRLSPQQV